MRLASGSFRSNRDRAGPRAGLPLCAGSAAIVRRAGSRARRNLETGRPGVRGRRIRHHQDRPDRRKAVALCRSVQKVMLGNAGLKVDHVALKGDSWSSSSRSRGPNTFQGTLAKDGPDAGKVLGTFTFRGEIYPARLDRTEAQKVAEMKPSPLVQEFFAAAQDHDPKSKAGSSGSRSRSTREARPIISFTRSCWRPPTRPTSGRMRLRGSQRPGSRRRRLMAKPGSRSLDRRP